MEIAYIMTGKRFKANDHNDLNTQLNQFGLITNLDSRGLGSLSVRRLSEPQGTYTYGITQSFGDSADIKGYDVCIGKIIRTNSHSGEEVIEFSDLSELEKVFKEVRQDIPDAKIIVGSYWS